MTQDTLVRSETQEEKSPDAFKTISEVSELLGVPQHVLRFWESKFPQIKPLYRGGRRYYRPEDIDILTKVQHLLYKQGYTINGAKKAFNDKPKAVLKPQEMPVSLFTDKQTNQLSVIRQELVGLRDLLKPLVTS